MKMKIINNVFKITACIILLAGNITYFIIRKEFPSIDQELSLIFAVMTIFTVLLPIDASIIITNIQKIRDGVR